MKRLTKYGPARPVEIYFEPSPDNPQVLRVKRRSEFSGKDNTMDLPITEEQLQAWLGPCAYPGRLIQDVMPHLSKGQREFLISGCSDEEWAKIVG